MTASTNFTPAEESPAPSTESLPVDLEAAAQYARSVRVPWKRALLRWLPREISLLEVYRRMGWGPGVASTRTKCPNLRISEVVRMADAIRAPRGKFLETLAEEMVGPPPRRPKIRRPVPITAVKPR